MRKHSKELAILVAVIAIVAVWLTWSRSPSSPPAQPLESSRKVAPVRPVPTPLKGESDPPTTPAPPISTPQQGKPEPSENLTHGLSPTINGIRLGMTLPEIEQRVGPTHAFIPPDGEKPKLMSFGREVRPDGMGYSDFTEVGFNDRGEAIYISGSRLFVGEVTLDGNNLDLDSPDVAAVFQKVFGEDSLTRLQEGDQVHATEGDLRAWNASRSRRSAIVFKSGERP